MVRQSDLAQVTMIPVGISVLPHVATQALSIPYVTVRQ